MKLSELEYSIPDGWFKTFGQMLVDEVNEVDPTTRVIEAKEKFGSLRIYFDNSGDYYKVDKIIEKYSVLSENICAICGKPDVHMTDVGWVYPLCEDCYKKTYRHTDKPYPTGEGGRMVDSYKVYKWVNGSLTKIEIDISDTTNKIREKWRAEHDSN